MKNDHQDDPFTNSSSQDRLSTDGTSTNGNTASAALLAIIVPGALVFSGFAGCTVLWLVSHGNPMIRVAGGVVLISDLAVAAFFRYFFLNRRKPTDN